MDIEWAEYQIIDDMLTKGWPENIRQIRVEWHGVTYNDFIRKKSEFLTEQIQSHNCEFFTLALIYERKGILNNQHIQSG